MIEKLRAPSPALVISLIALFISLSSTAIAQTPVGAVKRALFADNAAKLKGKTLKQVVRTPGPASTAGDLVFARDVSRVLAPRQETDVTASCGPTAKAIGAGFFSDGGIATRDSRASTDNAWTMLAVNLGETSAEITVQAICLR